MSKTLHSGPMDSQLSLHPLLADDQIRILEVLSGQHEDEIICTLQPVALHALPEYEAVSYVWDDPKVTKPITINNASFDITVNLEAALRHVRQPGTSRLLWVDAICINQADGAEKMQQIRLMRDIYQNCKQVLIWMGDFKTHGLTAEQVRAMFDTIAKLAENGKLLEEDLNANFYLALDAVMQESWWKRLWTVQEVVLPPCAAIVWGTESTSWSSLEDASWASCHQGSWPQTTWAEHHIINRFTVIVRTLVIAKESDADDFCQTLVRFMDRQATEPRDRIFGIFGLLPPDERGSFHIPDDDYAVDIVKVHFQLAVELIRSTNSLRCFIGLTGALHMTPGLPTWAMDWASGTGKIAMCDGYWNHTWLDQEFNASAGRPLDMSVNEQDLSITLTGNFVDRVVWVHNIPGIDVKDSRHGQAAPLIELYAALRDRVEFDEEYPLPSTGISNEEAILRTVLTDFITEENGSPPERRVESSDSLLLENFLSGCSDAEEDCLCQSLMAYAAGHVFFITAKGYFGMGARHMQVEDEIWILFGGRTPYVLKPATNFSPRHYTLVGDCYSHGVMDGEAASENALEESVTLH